MNVDQIRTMVRAQMDLDDSDLPNQLLDSYIQDGFNRIIGLETCWPFYETLWTVPVPETGVMPLPTNAREVVSILSANGRVVALDMRHAEDMFGWPSPTSGGPTIGPSYWSQLGTAQIMFWPTPIPPGVQVQLRGYRKPADWVAAGAGSEVDADDRLHLPIVWYCCSVGYAQQEDEVLEQVYMNRFNQSVAVAHDDVMRVWSGQPKQVNGYSTFVPRRARFTLQTPGGTP